MDLERFGRIVFDRRRELDLTQDEVAENGGPTDTTLGKIERVEWTPGNRKVTLRKLDVGLQWEPGSALQALNGGDPTPLRTTPLATRAAPPTDSIDFSQNNRDLLATLNTLLESGELTQGSLLMVEVLRDDTLIDRFPEIYEELSRTGQLKVARYGQAIYDDEQKEKDNALPTDPPAQQAASSEADEEQKTKLRDEAKERAAVAGRRMKAVGKGVGIEQTGDGE